MASASWTFGNLRPDEKGLKPMPIEGSVGETTFKAVSNAASFLSSLGWKFYLTVAIFTAIVATSSIAAIDAIRATEDDDKSCISVSDIDAAQTAWAGAAVAIGNAWINENCTGALREAEGALNAAYTFDQELLFKPTLTQPPDTFRRTRAGTLSYFIGHCAPEGAVGTDKGFALGYSVGDPNNQSTWQGFTSVSFFNMTYTTSGAFCGTALAQGKMSYVSRYTGVAHFVDKTFVYVKNPNPTKNSIPLITVHHSSEQPPCDEK